MTTNNNGQADDINLLKIIKYLCSTKIRHPMNIEQIKAWLKQFKQGPERILALLILRHLIYRTSNQLESSLKQALKWAATSFIPNGYVRENIDWRDVLNGKAVGLDFYYGPPKHEHTPPGKSGEIITRQLKFCIPLDKSQLSYPDQITTLKPNERYLLIDDGSYTGEQLTDFIRYRGKFMIESDQTGVVVGLAHEHAIGKLAQTYPKIPIFYGEKITPQECFVSMSDRWVSDGMWQFPHITPLDQYIEIVKTKAKFKKEMPLGYGGLGCLIAYEHGIPDDSLQLLWGESDTWHPLFER